MLPCGCRKEKSVLAFLGVFLITVCADLEPLFYVEDLTKKFQSIV